MSDRQTKGIGDLLGRSNSFRNASGSVIRPDVWLTSPGTPPGLGDVDLQTLVLPRPHNFSEQEPQMEMLEILTDVATARRELAALTDMDPARLHFCDDVIRCLENELEVTILKPWIPKTFAGCEAAIVGTLQRIEETEELIVQATPAVLLNKFPDHLIRLNVALLSLATLRFQLRTLFDVAATLYHKVAYAN